MIIGSGQLAKTFQSCQLNDTVIFASGVSNSHCTDKQQFSREENLLRQTLQANKDKRFVYFSSCALSCEKYEKTPYYQHKQAMEDLIKQQTENYYIFRIPQLFGELKSHNTLINFLYFTILEEKPFKLFSESYRYIIEIEDVKTLVNAYLQYKKPCITVNIANPYRYKVIEIVEIFEQLLGKKANYELIDKHDGFILNLDELESFIKQNKLSINFSSAYLKHKLKEKIPS